MRTLIYVKLKDEFKDFIVGELLIILFKKNQFRFATVLMSGMKE